MDLTALNTWKYPIPQSEIHHVVNPDPYRGQYGADANRYAKDVQDLIDYGTSGKVAGFIAETIQGIANGCPLAAVFTTPEIASAMSQKIHFNTYGGNQSTAGGLAVLKILDNEKRQAHCADVGSHMLERLRSLQQRHDKLGIIVGKGGLHGNVFRIKPPMCFSKDDADFLVDALDYSMTKF